MCEFTGFLATDYGWLVIGFIHLANCHNF